MNAVHAMTPAQKKQLLEHGYVVVEGLIDDATIHAVRDELHGVVDGVARSMVAEGKLRESFSDAGFDGQLARIGEVDEALAKEVIARVHGSSGEGGHMGPAMFDLIVHPRLLDAIESLVGREIIGSSVYRIRPKAPGLEKGAVPWHQDSGYLLGHCDKDLVITCWIPLVDANVENGCIYVIPDGHKGGICKHYTGGPSGYFVILDEDLPMNGKAIPVPVRRGGVLFLTNMTPHASYLNKSNMVRWSVDLRYQDPNVPHNVGVLPSEMDPDMPEVEVACYPAEADFVLRSAKHPEKVMRTWQDLKKLRDTYFDDRKNLRLRLKGRWAPLASAG